MRYVGAGVIAALGTAWISGVTPSSAQTGTSLTIQWLGHTCFLFTGNGLRILVNPFRTLGCTAGYRVPNVEADLVLISSQLLDEGGGVGDLPGNPQLLYQPGVYRFGGIEIQGVGIPHDREGGRRFGTNVAWAWTQGGIKVLHLGGAAAPIETDQRILLGRPDVALIPVGGGPKAYDPQQAKAAMEALNPKVVIPTHYRTAAAEEETCDIVAVDEFIKLVGANAVRRMGSDQIVLSPSTLPSQGTAIQIPSYPF